jgi:streptogramin lyase
MDDAGQPVPGVPVTFRHGTSGIAVTVLSGPDGTFNAGLERFGAHVAGAGGRLWSASSVEIEVPENTPVTLDFTVSRVETPLAVLPSAHWLSLLPEGAMKREFMVNCTSCHGIGYPRVVVDGKHRNQAQWLDAITLMRESVDQYKLTPPDFEDARYARWLAEHLTAAALSKAAPLPPPAAEALNARYTEYPVPARPSLPHDLVVGPKGRIWIAAFFNDEVWALIPATGEIEAFPVNQKPDTWGQARALEFDRTGKLWVLLGGANAVVKLDPESGLFETHDAGMYGHSLDLDSAGNIWFNDYFGKPERIGGIDGKTGALTAHPLPSANLDDAEGLPLPYGLQIDQDDVLWITGLASNTLVRFDTRTGNSKAYEMPTPNSGPRRPGIGPDGRVWIPEWSTGKLAEFDPKTERFTEYQPSLSTIGPYDVDVNQKTGEVWMTASLSSSIFRFDPKTEKWTEFRWPTEPAYTRHIAVDEATGDVWSAYASLPEAEPKIVRLQPNG